MSNSSAPTGIYRLDKFVVPGGAREEFLSKVRQTHTLLESQPGFIRDILLEKPTTGGEFIIVTLVEWQDGESLAAARDLVAAEHRKSGFNMREFLAGLGVEAEIGTFARVQP